MDPTQQHVGKTNQIQPEIFDIDSHIKLRVTTILTSEGVIELVIDLLFIVFFIYIYIYMYIIYIYSFCPPWHDYFTIPWLLVFYGDPLHKKDS